MDLKPFCNRCLKSDPKALFVTSCRHVLCSDCYSKYQQKCALCQTTCKVIAFDQLPEEMAVYFKPILPVLLKYQKIAHFQIQQRSLWTSLRKPVLERVHQKRTAVREKKARLLKTKQNYKRALEENAELKRKLKKVRRTEPRNPFEMNSNRHHSPDPDTDKFRSHVMRQKNSNEPPPPAARSFNTSSLYSRSNASSIIGHSPMMMSGSAAAAAAAKGRASHFLPRHMNSTVNTASFFNGSAISASSSLNSTGNSGASRTGQVRRLLQSSSIRTPTMNYY